MPELSYEELIRALPKTELRPAPSSPLQLKAARAPTFVPPTLVAADPGALTSSVLVICAPAAVGKSMLAEAISADARLPILDLAVVPVATGSLRACFTDLGPDGEQHFTSGRVAFLIDALDEGRLLSGDPGFRAFFESAAPLLAGAGEPRVVLLGRPESADLAIHILRAVAPHISVSRLELGFFDEKSARQLVATYADQEAKDRADDCGAYLKHRSASDGVVDAYFDAIARALGLELAALWVDNDGRALAGYAPVLAALGTLLARLDNFQAVAQALKKEGKQQAWEVIETVVRELLVRERAKQCKTLIESFGDAVLSETYDQGEQLALVVQHVLGRGRFGTGQLKFADRRVRDAYAAMIEQQLPEHPFVQDGRFRNQVFASIALAAELRRGALDEDARDELVLVSRQPFLWRSFLRSDSENALIDGQHLGFLLDSLWSDPVSAKGRVTVKPQADAAYVEVSIPDAKHPLTVVVPPIVFFGQIVHVDFDLPNIEVRFDGRSLRGQGALFTMRSSFVTSGSLDFRAQNVLFEGRSWLSADTLIQAPAQARLESGAEVGWGGAIASRKPFRDHPSVVQDPHPRSRVLGLEGMLAEMTRRQLPPTLVLGTNYLVADNERGGPLMWLKEHYEETLQNLVQLLVKHGAAKESRLASKGTVAKVTVHSSVTWSDLLDECRELGRNPEAKTAHRSVLVSALQESQPKQ